ncbi:hypothetical protein TOPH_02174 [Tolypocladium ophioglossoides CBS 100239]|uniref:Uncharacterized protein n=1 Tax=Tolypocladium ophioglossoides (strain CBS 100239) TaxID=1163406 RepID=A0A0L0NG26_TOLOC|nr:hypothetical protein TOPH_02174 [Tolypocladium ophioglossoides CBS 100239]
MESARIDHALSRWSSQYLDAMQPYKNPRAALQLPDWMRSAGFTEVESRLLTLPMCAWSNEPRDRNIGLANSENVAQLLQSLALYPFMQLKGMSMADFERLIEQARSEASNPSFKLGTDRLEPGGSNHGGLRLESQPGPPLEQAGAAPSVQLYAMSTLARGQIQLSSPCALALGIKALGQVDVIGRAISCNGRVLESELALSSGHGGLDATTTDEPSAQLPVTVFSTLDNWTDPHRT